MKICVNCGKLWEDEETKVYNLNSFIRYIGNGKLQKVLIPSNQVIEECCPECGGNIENIP